MALDVNALKYNIGNNIIWQKNTKLSISTMLTIVSTRPKNKFLHAIVENLTKKGADFGNINKNAILT